MKDKQKKMTIVSNFLTFDIEEWYHANYDGVDFSQYTDSPTNLETNVDQLIALCSKYHVKSTCFILGMVAQHKPQIVKKLHNAGHEIASHGYSHKLVYAMRPEEFKEDLKTSCDLLEALIGEKILGFRAPSWSVNHDTLDWYYAALEEVGLQYSSSVYPAKTFLYGIPDFPPEIHYPVVNGHQVNILEIPMPITSILRKSIGFSGGVYLRFFPRWFIQSIIKKHNNAGKSVFIYLHPREIDVCQPRLSLPFVENLIHYWGIPWCKQKLEKIIVKSGQTFIKMAEFVKIFPPNAAI